MDSLGDRMKRHEAAGQLLLGIKTPVIIRIDGRSFHTFTRKCEKPYDDGLISAMIDSTIEVAKEISGFKLAYVASDEASFIISDTPGEETQPWFGNNLSKIVSVASSLFTAHFNELYKGVRGSRFATFDARAFSIPVDDLPNYFVWRQKDWMRNSIQMYARAHFSDKSLHGKSTKQIVKDLLEIGADFSEVADVYRLGTWISKAGKVQGKKQDYLAIFSEENYAKLADYFGIPNGVPVIVEDAPVIVEEVIIPLEEPRAVGGIIEDPGPLLI